ncbi:major tail protein [Liquorilactobacillus hordei]|uniref:major tail protein n=1 Tax=Liquorilactobacillus hordei TaxID=468911 RepID=UPI001CBB057E|nr:major tail protein [Liquorilactobacillus hordei]MBZ2405119.1 phage tail protein [Liquorilactobacillus hordei]
MAITIGFPKLTIQPLDESFKKKGDPIVIQGDPQKGAMVKAEIKGLSKDPTKVSGSDIAYYVSRKGVGDVTVDFDVLDLPNDAQSIILGRRVSDNGVQYTGLDTEAPYCSILAEAADTQGNTALVGFFCGVFSNDGETLNTQEEGETFKPDPESYKFTATGSKTGVNKGEYMAKYAGDKEAAITEVRNAVLLESTAPEGNKG